MKYVFYITNHGFGHASRNVPIIEMLLTETEQNDIYIKSDGVRCDFIKRNISDEFNKRVHYFDDCSENGLILKDGQMIPNTEKMKTIILEDLNHWDEYVEREVGFLLHIKPDIVIADVICWALKAADVCKIKSLLIGNFTWEQMYKSFYGQELWGRYHDYYRMATKAIWYEIHDESLHRCCTSYELVSMVSRDIDLDMVKKIRTQYKKEKVFVSLGASAELKGEINVEDLPYEFLITRGVKMVGENVHVLPYDMINTPDYIAACDYVIAKGGWSTVAEILLQQKKCALLFRGNNAEDINTRKVLEKRRHCIGFEGGELTDIENIIKKIKQLEPLPYDMYWDDNKRICDIINNTIKER